MDSRETQNVPFPSLSCGVEGGGGGGRDCSLTGYFCSPEFYLGYTTLYHCISIVITTLLLLLLSFRMSYRFDSEMRVPLINLVTFKTVLLKAKRKQQAQTARHAWGGGGGGT